MSKRSAIQNLDHLKNKGLIRGYSLQAANEVQKNDKKRPKYRNKKVLFEGFVFDSKKEFERWNVLKILLNNGNIRLLECQVTYELKVNKRTIAKYIADFRYVISATGEVIVEDVKGFKTPMYRLKKKLMQTIYNISIKET